MYQPTRPNPQHGPALALVELIRHPELPPLEWSLTTDGELRGVLTKGSDNTAAYAAYVRVLGGDRRTVSYMWRGAVRSTQYLHTTWRDVPVTVEVLSDADVVALVECHDAELAAGHPSEAHLLDDDRPWHALVIGCDAPAVAA